MKKCGVVGDVWAIKFPAQNLLAVVLKRVGPPNDVNLQGCEAGNSLLGLNPGSFFGQHSLYEHHSNIENPFLRIYFRYTPCNIQLLSFSQRISLIHSFSLYTRWLKLVNSYLAGAEAALRVPANALEKAISSFLSSALCTNSTPCYLRSRLVSLRFILVSQFFLCHSTMKELAFGLQTQAL